MLALGPSCPAVAVVTTGVEYRGTCDTARSEPDRPVKELEVAVVTRPKLLGFP